MKVIACLLVLCLAVSAFAQMPGGSMGAGRSAAGLAALMGSAGGRGGNSMLAYGALSGAMGDGMREFIMCSAMGLPRMMCMTRLM